jgi:hypothetical protein
MSEVKKIRYRVSKYTVKRQEWVEKYQSGQKINEIAEEEGVLGAIVRQQLEKAGIHFAKKDGVKFVKIILTSRMG